jgi:hypothetical protein
MEEKFKQALIGIILLILICCIGTVSIILGVFANRTKTTCDNKYKDYKSINMSTEKIIVNANKDDVSIMIPSNVCIDEKININITDGIIIGNTEVISKKY